MVRRWGFSSVLGYLGAGAVLGPFGLGSISNAFPGLSWFTISDAQNVAGIAQLGIVFLLFLIGLELSFPRLSAMRRLVVGLGGSQVLLTSAVIAGAAVMAGKNPPEAIVLGASLSLSSTAIVLELLSNQERLTTSVGRASFSILLAQDLAVIPDSVVRLHPGCKVQRVGSCQSRQRAVAGRGRRHRHRYLRSRAAATAVPAGCDRRLQRTVHRGRAVRDRRGRRDRRSGRPVDGARRLRCRLAARRDGIPQGDRSDSRAVQGPTARHFLLHRRHECRLPRAVARAALASWRRCQPDRRQIVAADRSWPAVSFVVAGRDRDRPAARSGRGICVRRHRHGVGYGSDRSAARQLHARCDLGHHGADAAAVIRRAVSHGAAHRRGKPSIRNWSPGRRADSSTQSWSAMAASARSCARCCGSMAFPISPPTPMRRP